MAGELAGMMQFDYRKMMESEQERSRIDASLDEFLSLEGDSFSRLKYKRKGPARESMVQALAQMAMLFAAANMGEDGKYKECLGDVLDQSACDNAARRALREFYLRNIERVPGTLGRAVARLARAKPLIAAIPVVKADMV